MSCDRRKSINLERVNTLSLAEELEEVENRNRRRSISDDIVDTLEVVVRLLQGVANQLSLATGKPGPGTCTKCKVLFPEDFRGLFVKSRLISLSLQNLSV